MKDQNDLQDIAPIPDDDLDILDFPIDELENSTIQDEQSKINNSTDRLLIF